METKHPKAVDAEKIELRPDGWERFRQAVHAAAKSGPKHKTPKPVKSAEIVKDAKNAHGKRDSGDNSGRNRSD